ncbi:oxidoreductase [Actinorhabdospora filicis]|uniref:Oxidoreductase n=1 Tax=Actinorhabdospora filicis TaxID=1785913 RepID=A0A9W6W3D8_9ACTN|nr:aldo/keto reductase [Actinorhabdospora filicis]GLZ78037.1 oxidoreductase [Actinorhabdospora filicis]
MEYTNLGRTGLRVSRLCLGTMNFGRVATEADSHAMMDTALDAGINFFDTSNSYGAVLGDGLSESFIGRWFAHGEGRRDKVVLATKVYTPMDSWPNNGGLSARNIIAGCEASLRRLGTDWIDLFQMHHVDRSVPWEEIWQAMETLVTAGKVRYVGSSNFAGWHLVAAQAAADRRNFLGLVSEQCLYNLATRHVELELLPAAREHGIGVLPWSPLHGGMLSGVLRKLRDGTATRSADNRSSHDLERWRSSVEGYENLAVELATDPADLGLAWLLAQPAVTAPIIGPRTVEQVSGALGALKLDLTPEILDRLDELFPPLGRDGLPGPEGWAW